MLDLTLRDLEYVAAVERERNFTRAAARIPMAQPALSQAIQRIERRLEVQLFERTSRTVTPTAAGTVLAARARQILDDVRRAAADAQIAGGGRELRVHVTEPSLQVPRRGLSAIRAAVPGVAVHQTTVPHAQVPTLLRSGDLTLALGARAVGDGLSSVQLCRETVVALMADSHPLAAQSSVTAADVCAYPMVSIDRAMSSWNTITEKMLARAGHSPRWTGSVAFGAVAGSDLVTDGQALLLVLDSIGLDQPAGRTCRPLIPNWDIAWYLSWRDGAEQVPAVGPAIAAVLDALGVAAG